MLLGRAIERVLPTQPPGNSPFPQSLFVSPSKPKRVGQLYPLATILTHTPLSLVEQFIVAPYPSVIILRASFPAHVV